LKESTLSSQTCSEGSALSLPADGCGSTLVDLLRNRAAHRGSRTAFSFLEDGSAEGEQLSFSELDLQARRIAGYLQASHAQGERALLLFPAGLDVLKAFFGCIYAGLVAIPAPAPEASRRKRTVPRLQAIARDADVTLVLAAGDTLELIMEVSRDVPELASLKFVDIRKIPDGFEDSWIAPALDGGDLAYLQYTSGSTTSPKGVMLGHQNVLHHCVDIRERCGYGPDSVSVTWLPYFHDYGLIEGLLVPLHNGTPCHVMSPFAFLKRPFSWLNAISRFKATHTQGPSFAYDQCTRRIKPAQLAQLDLSSLRSAGNGAEPVNPAVLDAFYEMFASRGLRQEALCPAYGLAEATLMVSCCEPSSSPRVGRFRADELSQGRVDVVTDESQPSRRITSCGRPLGNIRLAIVDPDTRRRCASGTVGEIWVSDPCVALGYWRRHQETQETFRAFVADTGEGPFLRTGDLGFMRDGELFVTSRIKDLIIVAGANHYPQDIEWTVERCHPAIRLNHVAASSVHVNGEEHLLVAPEVERGAIDAPEEMQALLGAIRLAITQGHELQVHAILVLRHGGLPKTASGKIQRHACAQLLRSESPDVLACWDAHGGRDAIVDAPAGNGSMGREYS
jgi:acyl-CoA synthetase (AMP-forming)/AMP-acid ligase II